LFAIGAIRRTTKRQAIAHSPPGHYSLIEVSHNRKSKEDARMGKATNSRKTPLLSRATITTKGQITLPSAVRRQLGLKPGDQVGFAEGRLIALPRRDDLSGLDAAAQREKSLDR